MSGTEDALRKIKIIAALLLACVAMLPMMSFAVQFPVANEAILLAWVLVFLMPMVVVMLFPIYLIVKKEFDPKSPIGPAVLMYMPGITPVVYALMITLIAPSVKLFGMIMGIISSVIGIFLAFVLLSRLLEEDHQDI